MSATFRAWLDDHGLPQMSADDLAAMDANAGGQGPHALTNEQRDYVNGFVRRWDAVDGTSEQDRLIVELDAAGYDIVTEPDVAGDDRMAGVRRRSDGRNWWFNESQTHPGAMVLYPADVNSDTGQGAQDLPPENILDLAYRLEAIYDAPEGWTEVAGNTTEDTHYPSYVLPGGEKYRELLLHLPGAHGETGQHTGITDPAFRAPHFAPYEKNLLAHVRFNARRDVEGKLVLFIEEIQSDFGEQYHKAIKAAAKAVDSDFAGIVERMERAGVLKVECD